MQRHYHKHFYLFSELLGGSADDFIFGGFLWMFIDTGLIFLDPGGFGVIGYGFPLMFVELQ